MPTIAAVKIFTYDELDDDAKEKARESVQEMISDDVQITLQTDFDNKDGYWTEEATKRGYTNLEWSWDFGYSQGSGVSFTATVDVRAWLKAHKLSNNFRLCYVHADSLSVRVVRDSSHYCHEHTCSVDTEQYYNGLPEQTIERLDKQLVDLAAAIESDRLALCREAYKGGCDEIEYYWKDENVAEWIKDCGDTEDDGALTFTASGRLWSQPS